MEIRNAISNDKKVVLEFCRDTFSWGDYIGDVWDRWQSKGRLHVLEEKGKVIGVYNFDIFENQAWIEGMRVHPKYRRKGFGKKMLLHAESLIQNKTIRLVIESQNRSSIELVSSMGYHLEEKWQLYSMPVEIHDSDILIANDISQVHNLINSKTYADSWKWLSLDEKEIQKLIEQDRVVIYVKLGITLAMGIWNRYKDFPNVLQVGYLNGTKDGMTEILRYIQNKAHVMNCERIQIFVHENTLLESTFLEKKSMFYLMRKDLN